MPHRVDGKMAFHKIKVNPVYDPEPEYLDFSISAEAKSTTVNVLSDLTSVQQMRLNQLKIKTIRANHIYLRKHPEIRALISIMLKRVLRYQPKTDVIKFLGKYFATSFYDIQDEVRTYLDHMGIKIPESILSLSITESEKSFALSTKEKDELEEIDIYLTKSIIKNLDDVDEEKSRKGTFVFARSIIEDIVDTVCDKVDVEKEDGA